MNTHASIHVACILAFALTAVRAGAQISTWSQLVPVNSPSNRSSHAMAYDAARQRVVLFGGSAGSGALGDTWGWDGTNWFPQFSLNYPSARANHAMAYDSARQRVVLFGGYVPGSLTSLSDTWEWDGINWVQRSGAGPSSRIDHAMAYDAARQRVVLFGGYVPGPGPYPGTTSTTVLSDTWEWDGNTWVQRAPAASPPSRARHAMAYDALRQRTVLCGGYYFQPFGSIPPIMYLQTSRFDTWEWNGSNWVQAVGSAGASGHTMAYDAARQRTVLFNGNTHAWNGNAWTQLSTSPPPPAWNPIAYDEAHQRIILFGSSGETWVLDQAVLSASATAYGAGCGSPPLDFVPDANSRPILGQVGRATIVNAPWPAFDAAGVAIGGSNQFFGPFSLPVTLAGIGMPGCDLWQSADILGLPTSQLTPSTLSFSLAIPNVVNLLGVHLYLQSYAFAPGVNPLQMIISNGIDWMLGNT